MITIICFGLAYNAACTLFHVIQRAFYCIKTCCGISDPIYDYKIVLLAVYGQWNGLGPIFWALISMVILTMCKKASNRIKFLTSITKIWIPSIAYIFVDNADIMQGDKKFNTRSEYLIHNFQEFMRW